jgi:protoheme IX farnesyltransferase
LFSHLTPQNVFTATYHISLRKSCALEYHFFMSDLMTTASTLKENYWPLIKSRQTLLLTLTGAAGYLCHPPLPTAWWRFSGLVASLLISITGCTVINMLFDRDIDRRMKRTSQRPLATGQLMPHTAGLLGIGLIGLGLVWAISLSLPYFFVILAGVGFNVLVYTLWLKRRTAWSILFGGVAGGMPILAGRTLAVGHLDLFGFMLALVVLFWIPSHNLTLSMLYTDDYINAAVPTFPIVYGTHATRLAITLSSLLAALTMIFTWVVLGANAIQLTVMVIFSLGLLILAILPGGNPKRNFITMQYKYSSIYMLLSMIWLIINGTV